MEAVQSPINHTIVERFETLLARDRLAHAYLFIGPRSVGKRETAQAIAKSLCSDIDTHFYEVAYGEKLKIEHVRELLGQIKLRPFNSNRKVFILCDIDTLTVEASNSLLKTLEEPSKDSLLILTTSVPENILDTIRSRCHVVYFTNFSPEQTCQDLQNDYRAPVMDATFLSTFTNGNTAQAAYLWDKGFPQIKNAWLDEYLHGHDTDQFIKSELKEKETQKMFLDVMLTWVRDALLVKSGVTDERIIHQDRKKDLELFSNQTSFDSLNELYKQIVMTYRQLNENLNIKMSLLIIKGYFRG